MLYLAVLFYNNKKIPLSRLIVIHNTVMGPIKGVEYYIIINMIDEQFYLTSELLLCKRCNRNGCKIILWHFIWTFENAEN